MGITDIPDQIAKAIKYSLRSPSSFAVSLVTAMVVFGIAYDLAYSFAYIRILDVKDAKYGPVYGWGLLIVAVAIPVALGLLAYLRARHRARPFDPAVLGIAFAPFEVFSVAPETLGTASLLQALDIVGTQFISVVENNLNEYGWAKEFEFRFLPQYMRIKTKEQAIEQRSALGATLLFWGVITQRTRMPLEIKLNLQGMVQTYNFTDFSVEDFPMVTLNFFTLFEGAKALRAAGVDARAIYLFEQARPLAIMMDAKSKGEGGLVAEIDANLAQLRPPPAIDRR